MNVKQVSIFIEHVPGTLHSVMNALTEKDIHIRAFSVVETGGVSVVRIIVDNVLWTASALKAYGCPATFTEVVVAAIPNTQAEFCRLLEVMKDAGINIEYSYSVMMKSAEAGFVFEVNDVAKAAEALRNAGIRVVPHEELYAL